MTSTRNNNSLGDYEAQQIAIQKQAEYQTYVNGASGMASETYFAGDGLLSGRLAATSLSQNACDVESFLFGIGSVNLVSPKSRIIPEIHRIQSLSIIQKTPVILPADLVIMPNQRYLST